MYRTETRTARLARIKSELERLNVDIECLPSGALRLRRGFCHLMVASFEEVTDDNLVDFAGGRSNAVLLRPAAYEAR